jgi:hypothetical protein
MFEILRNNAYGSCVMVVVEWGDEIWSRQAAKRRVLMHEWSYASRFQGIGRQGVWGLRTRKIRGASRDRRAFGRSGAVLTLSDIPVIQVSLEQALAAPFNILGESLAVLDSRTGAAAFSPPSHLQLFDGWTLAAGGQIMRPSVVQRRRLKRKSYLWPDSNGVRGAEGDGRRTH